MATGKVNMPPRPVTKPARACLGDLPVDEAIDGIVGAAMLRAIALCQIFQTVDARKAVYSPLVKPS